MQVILVVAVASVLVIGGLIWWLASSKYNLGRIESEVKVHRIARERRRKADEIAARQVADEAAWLAEQRARYKRLQDRRRRN